MLLIEADGKSLFAEAGVPVPPGCLVGAGAIPDLPGPGPWVVKAQVPAGGRGKAGLIRRCADPAAVDAALREVLGATHKGHRVETCLIEPRVTGAEHYLALMLDPARYAVRLLYHPHGGIDVEEAGALTGIVCAPDPAAIAAAVARTIPHPGVAAAANALGRLLLERELMLAEINPLFVTADTCVAGDAKVVIDLNALPRQPRLTALIEARPEVYADANRKLASGFDYVEIDPAGSIGLLTTGAGLSMMLIDELVARGAAPAQFLRHPHLHAARQPGADRRGAGLDDVAPVLAGGAGQHLRRHHRSRRVRRAAGRGAGAVPGAAGAGGGAADRARGGGGAAGSGRARARGRGGG